MRLSASHSYVQTVTAPGEVLSSSQVAGQLVRDSPCPQSSRNWQDRYPSEAVRAADRGFT